MLLVSDFRIVFYRQRGERCGTGCLAEKSMDHANFLAVSVYFLCVLLGAGAGGDGGRWRTSDETITTNNHCRPVCNESVIVGVVHGSVWRSCSLPAISSINGSTSQMG
jgi:hypothetical protein